MSVNVSLSGGEGHDKLGVRLEIVDDGPDHHLDSLLMRILTERLLATEIHEAMWNSSSPRDQRISLCVGELSFGEGQDP